MDWLEKLKNKYPDLQNINFVNMHRYQAIERAVYQKVKEWRPNVIVELGHGGGSLTVAMGLALKEVNPEGVIYSYDVSGVTDYNISGATSNASMNIKERDLTEMVHFTEGDVFDTWIKNPCPFDLLLIDINNEWNNLYSIVIANSFINNQIKKGAKVLIEGGDPNHPRINQNTLDFFNNSCGGEIFTMKHLDGSGRTSISILEI